MAHHKGLRTNALGFTPEDMTGFAAGAIIFGALMVMLLGSFHIIEGSAALLDDNFYFVRSDYAGPCIPSRVPLNRRGPIQRLD